MQEITAETCKAAFEKEQMIYNQNNEDESWLRKIMQSGTTKDKLAATVAKIVESPMHNTKHLQNLINSSQKNVKRECQPAIKATADLFYENLLPDNVIPSLTSRIKKAKPNTKQSVLAQWYYEDVLKNAYNEFVTVLESAVYDNLIHHKTLCLKAVYNLLVNKPEQEKRLLTILVNKLGDPQKKVSSRVSQLLIQLLEIHPVMVQAVIKEIKQVVFREKASKQALYFGTVTLSQLTLKKGDDETVNLLLSVYFFLFQLCIKTKDTTSKLLGAILTGVNRAIPFLSKTNHDLDKEISVLFKIVRISPFNSAIQALMILHQMSLTNPSVADRFFVALYERLLGDDIRNIKNTTLLFNLLYKSIKGDLRAHRVRSFVKRILQVACHVSAPFAAGSLALVSALSRDQPCIKEMIKEADCSLHLTEAPKKEKKEETENKKTENKKKDNKKKDKKPTKDDKPAARGDEDDEYFYDPTKRNPLFAGANESCLWELQFLMKHYNPSVATFAKTLAGGKYIKHKGDPTEACTHMSFLDRFVCRNPKDKDIKFAGMRESEAFYSEFLSKQEAGAVSMAAKKAKTSSMTTDEELEEYADKLVEDLIKRQHGGFVDDGFEDEEFEMSSDSESEGEEPTQIMGGSGKVTYGADVMAMMAGAEDEFAEGEDIDDLEIPRMINVEGEEALELSESGSDIEDLGSNDEFDGEDNDDEDQMVTDDPGMLNRAQAGQLQKLREAALNDNVFASADDFAELLESSGGSKKTKQDEWAESQMDDGKKSRKRGRQQQNGGKKKGSKKPRRK
eukprot:TRINITY_DN781838_c0_g1_i1.p1 TRINITY_DN781838_c0_g1~~TRINITY_DN781838_c0_g1_i1.p1  ORF type:complete len:790 (+),score=322.45 TRINITY_DN781838_c0_g1_i1:111-2480(+)